MNLGSSEIFLILVVVLLLFGGKRLPELARMLGKGLAEFRRAAQDIQRDIQSPVESRTPSKPTSTAESERNVSVPSVNAHPAAQPRSPEIPSGSDS